jgi:hypothetical protein
MMRELWLYCEDPRLRDRIRALWSGDDPLRVSRGVYKYRSFEQMCAESAEGERERAERMRGQGN